MEHGQQEEAAKIQIQTDIRRQTDRHADSYIREQRELGKVNIESVETCNGMRKKEINKIKVEKIEKEKNKDKEIREVKREI